MADNKNLSEFYICTQFIHPALIDAGWDLLDDKPNLQITLIKSKDSTHALGSVIQQVLAAAS